MTVQEPTITAPLQLGSEGKYTFTPLTAAGVTDALAVKSIKDHTLAVTIAAINTNVVVRAEGSLDGTNWFSLMPGNDLTITANETHAIVFHGELEYIRGNFVSELGGTAATVAFAYNGGLE